MNTIELMTELEKRAGNDEVSRVALGFVQNTIGVLNSIPDGHAIRQSIETPIMSRDDVYLANRVSKLSGLILKIHSIKPNKAMILLNDFELVLDRVSLNPEKKYKLRRSDFPLSMRYVWLQKEGYNESDIEWVD